MATVRTSLMLLVAAVVVAVGVYGPTTAYQDVLSTFRAVSRVNSTYIHLVTSLLHKGLGYINFSFLLMFSLLLGLFYITRIAYNYIFYPVEYYANEAEFAYNINKPSKGMTTEERVREMKRERDFGEIPPVYPNGWFMVIRSDELKKGETKYVKVLGMNLAVFRGDSGRSYILDAYCPHLGANLGMGGTVHDDCIACPFHGWTFRGEDGKCVKIGYAEKVPEFAKVKTHRSLEINHLIMIWYHAEGEEPSWFPPKIEEVKSGKWIYQGFSTAFFDCHIQDVVENNGDNFHISYLHATKHPLKGLSLTYKWEIKDKQEHIVVAYTVATKDNKTQQTISEQLGPGLLYIRFSNDIPQRKYIILCHTPVGPLRQRTMVVGYSGTGLLDRISAKYAVKITLQVESADHPIWANKIYRPKPMFVKEDSHIIKHRRWFSQFYSENSPRYNPKTSLEW